MPAIISSALLLIATVSAAEPSVPFDPVFECYRVNSAWGFSMSGAAIGRDGTVVHYRLRDKDLRPLPQEDDAAIYYDASILRARFIDATPSNTVVDADTLRGNIALIGEAAKGIISASPTGVRDAGASSCHAYVPDAATHRYRDVQLGSDEAVSDMRFDNDAKAAKTILDWLKIRRRSDQVNGRLRVCRRRARQPVPRSRCPGISGGIDDPP